MTSGEALHEFFNSFDVPAYPETAVPDDAGYPRITYSVGTGYFGEGEMALTANIWYRGESEAEPTAKAVQIGDEIGRNGCTASADGGYIWLKRGSPFMTVVPDEDNSIKRRKLNITAEFFI